MIRRILVLVLAPFLVLSGDLDPRERERPRAAADLLDEGAALFENRGMLEGTLLEVVRPCLVSCAAHCR
jgi:hypothetical protein